MKPTSHARLAVSLSSGRTRVALAALAAVTLGAALPAAAADFTDGKHQYARGRIVVETAAGVSADELDKILKPHGGKRRKLGQSNLAVIELPPGTEQDAVARLRRNPAFKSAELDRKFKSTLAVTDPYIGSEWHLAKINAISAWDSTQGAGVTIAILDSGVDASHADLAPNLVPGYNTYENNTDTSDACGHGTAVAGSAAARSDNGTGVAAVAGQARIMPIRVAYYDAAAGGCYAYASAIASGITWAADHGARVANVSYGPVAGVATVQNAAQYMKSKGGLVFVSAGNNGVDENITPTSTMITVSATDAGDARAGWSSYGSFVTIAAPGAGIWTTSAGNGYGAWSGTSFASPVAAGVAALMMAAAPSLDGSVIEQALFASSVDLGAAGRDPLFGYGRVDADAAVKAALAKVGAVDGQAPSAAITSPSASASVSGLVTVTVNASDNVGVDRVELSANGTVVGSDNASPYSFSWNSANVANGMVNLVATAYDRAGNAGASAPLAINVANVSVPVTKDTTPPVVRIDNPVSGAVSGNVAINVSASDNSGAAGIGNTLYVDNAVVATGKGGALSYTWRTKRNNAGTHTITAVSKDAAGNSASTSVTVTVR